MMAAKVEEEVPDDGSAVLDAAEASIQDALMRSL